MTAARAAAARRSILGRIVIWLTLIGATFAIILTLTVVSMFSALNGEQDSGAYQPSPRAVADIPDHILPIYLQAGESRGIDWAILAAIGSIETNHGQSTAPGVRSGVNTYGCCAGPMQFMITGANHGTWGTYAVDGNHDGRECPPGSGGCVYDPADAIPAAADYLKARGAPPDYPGAIFAYNHAHWYVAKVIAKAADYRGTLTQGSSAPLVANTATAQQILRLADGPSPRITLRPTHRHDLSTGQIDPRVMSLLATIVRSGKYRIEVWSLKSDHNYLTSGGRPSNHAFGRAVDIGKVNGVQCNSTQQGRSGPCWALAQDVAKLLVARLSDRPLRGQRGRRLHVTFHASRSVAGVLRLSRGGRGVTLRSIRAKRGTNTIVLRLPRRPGTFRLELRVHMPGQSASDSALLKIAP